MRFDKHYEKLQCGSIKQRHMDIDMEYGDDYIDARYTCLPLDIRSKMAGLRLGYLLGNVQNISSVLDVGFGSGDFLKLANEYGIRSEGIECEGVSFPSWVGEGDYSRRYDVVCFFDSLEHFQSIDFIKDLDCKYLYISLPWCHFCDGDLSESWFREWKHRRYGEHLWHFSKKSLTSHLESLGYDVISAGNPEDAIRVNPLCSRENILTVIARKR